MLVQILHANDPSFSCNCVKILPGTYLSTAIQTTFLHWQTTSVPTILLHTNTVRLLFYVIIFFMLTFTYRHLSSSDSISSTNFYSITVSTPSQLECLKCCFINYCSLEMAPSKACFDYSNRSAVIQDGVIYYSPNCTWPVIIPLRPVYSDFIPLAPSFIFTPFESLCAMPSIEEVAFSFDGPSGDLMLGRIYSLKYCGSSSVLPLFTWTLGWRFTYGYFLVL